MRRDQALANQILLVTADGSAAPTIMPVLEGRGMAVTVADDLEKALARLGDFQLIILDAPDASRVASLCRRIKDSAGSHRPPILAIAQSSDVEARVSLLEAGADDVIAQPVDQREIEALTEALMLRAPGVASGGDSSTEASRAPGPTLPGRVIVFVAAKGGSGTTSLAVNTAMVLAEMAPGNVTLADFDMYHGQASTHLDIYARNSTAQLAHEDASLLTPDNIREAGRQHASGLVVFGGPYRPDEGADVRADQLVTLAQALRSTYGTTVIDAGSVVDLRNLSLLADADSVVMPITPDIPSLRLLHAALEVMSDAGPIVDRTIFVVNDIYPRHTIAPQQIEEHLGIKVNLEIPYDGENFLRAVNEGQPLMMLARRSPAAAQIRALAELTANTRPTEAAAPAPEKRGRFGGLLRRN